MGNYASKLFSRHEENDKTKLQTDITMGALEKNEMCTPIMSKKASVDPRSATVGITRTPIEVISTPPALTRKSISAIPKYLQMKQYLETDLDLILPVVTLEKRILDPRSPNITQQRTPILIKESTEYLSPIVIIDEGPCVMTPEDFDPRSPATNFDRTPILKTKSSEQNEKCNIKMSYCETIGHLNIPEIQALPEISAAIITPRNLEECIRFCEEENSEKNLNENIYLDNSEESEAEDQITVIPNFQIMGGHEGTRFDGRANELTDIIDTEQVKGAGVIQSLTVNAKIENEGEKGKIQIWSDSMLSLPHKELQIDNNLENTEETLIEFENETIRKAAKIPISKSHIKFECKLKGEMTNKSIKKIQKLKKDSIGLFDDGNSEMGKNRTPLANRSNNNKTDILSKSPQQVLKYKSLSTKSGQQENTPPNSKRFRSKIKSYGTHWDADRTVII